MPRLPARADGSHKGTFGTVCVFGGCCAGDHRMIGAPALSAAAALRTGTGLAKLFVPEPILASAIAITPSATGIAIPTGEGGAYEAHVAAEMVDRAASEGSCLALGPGLGKGEGPASAALRAVQQHDVNVVVDADALNMLATIPDLARDFHAAAVLTPHPGEYRTLAGSLNIDLDPTDERQRPAAAEALAQRLGCVVVLKGHRTVISDGLRTAINTTGNAALATAGTGDVLTGIIAGLVAQFVAPPQEPRPHPMPPKPRPKDKPLDLFDAARVGAYLHGRAAELWSAAHGTKGGMLASDLLAFIPAAVEERR